MANNQGHKRLVKQINRSLSKPRFQLYNQAFRQLLMLKTPDIFYRMTD